MSWTCADNCRNVRWQTLIIQLECANAADLLTIDDTFLRAARLWSLRFKSLWYCFVRVAANSILLWTHDFFNNSGYLLPLTAPHPAPPAEYMDPTIGKFSIFFFFIYLKFRETLTPICCFCLFIQFKQFHFIFGIDWKVVVPEELTFCIWNNWIWSITLWAKTSIKKD